MKFRDHYFKREATIANSDTVTIDLDIRDPISYITVEYEATTGATSCLNRELHDDVKVIEVVDGSDVLASLSMLEWRGVNFVERKQLPPWLLTETGASKQEEACTIYFGRYPDDPEYYLDPKKFTNPQLRLTHSLSISATAGFESGTGRITVMARIIEEGAKPQQGFMMTKRIYNWTSAGSGDEPVDLPRDYPYRYLFTKTILSNYSPTAILERIKLSCDADKYIPINNYMEDIVDQNIRRLGLAQQVKTIFRPHTGTASLDLYDIRKASTWCRFADRVSFIRNVSGESVTINLLNLATVGTPAWETVARASDVIIEGTSPHGILGIFFGDPNDPASFFPAPAFGSVRLFATQIRAGADCAIILQQIRK